MRGLTILALALVVVPALATAQTLESAFFQAELTPSAETPLVTDRDAVAEGRVSIHIRRDDMGAFMQAFVDFDVSFYVGQPEELIAMHIHRGAAGQNGPIVISSQGLDFGTSPVMAPEAGSGRVWKQAVIEAGDAAAINTLEAIMANPAGFYLNVHSTSHRPGLFRGQLRVAEFAAIDEARSAIEELEARMEELSEAELEELSAIRTLVRKAGLALGVVRRGE